MSTFIDITAPVQAGMPCWPGSPGVHLLRTRDRAAGDPANNSLLVCDVHAGTHVDAPLHHLADGADAASIPLTALIGPAVVAHLTHSPDVTAPLLQSLALPTGTQRLLLRTRPTTGTAPTAVGFDGRFVALTRDAAEWVAQSGLLLIGTDAPSIQRFHDGPEAHLLILAAGIVIVEGLDLSRVSPGNYELFCLPLPLVSSDGAPARAVLRSLTP